MSLLHRVKNLDDKSSWEEFYETYRKMLLNTALRAGLTQPEAEDAVQETFRDIARVLPDFQYDAGSGSFKKRLLKLVHWRIIDQLRQRPPVVQLPNDPSTTTAPINRVADPASLDWNGIFDEEWAHLLYEKAWERVRRKAAPRDVQIYDCHAHKQWAPEKVAEFFRTTVNAAYIAKHKVVELMREEVARLEKELS